MDMVDGVAFKFFNQLETYFYTIDFYEKFFFMKCNSSLVYKGLTYYTRE